MFIVIHCVFLIAFCSDLENELRTLNKIIKIEMSGKKKLSARRRIEVKRKLFDIIKFHCDAKQFSECVYSVVCVNE